MQATALSAAAQARAKQQQDVAEAAAAEEGADGDRPGDHPGVAEEGSPAAAAAAAEAAPAQVDDQPAASEAGQGVEHILSDMVQGMVSCCPAGATRVRGLRLSGGHHSEPASAGKAPTEGTSADLPVCLLPLQVDQYEPLLGELVVAVAHLKQVGCHMPLPRHC